MNLPATEPSSTRYRVAAIQYEPMLGEKDRNVADLLRLTAEAAQNGARLIVHPEMAATGYCWLSREEIAPFVEPLPGPTTDRFSQLAAQYDCYIATSLPEVDPATNIYYNSLALIGPSGLIGVYRKVHSYSSEPRWARDGDLGFPVWDTPLGRLGGIICQDASFFESTRLLALRGADVLLFPTNWLDEKCPNSWWMARAFENGCYLIAADRYGLERSVQFSGGSCIINPDGTLQTYLDSGEGIVYGDIDLQRSRDKRWGPSIQQSNGGSTVLEPVGNCIEDRRPAEYITLTHNTYLWEPLKYHSLYDLGELPPGQLSCVGIIQTDLQAFYPTHTQSQAITQADRSPIERLSDMLRTTLRDHESTRPDILVLPELILPGAFPDSGEAAAMQANAIEIPGPETDALSALAAEFQLILILGVAERFHNNGAGENATTYYNSVLLVDPEGVYGTYRKLHLTNSDRLWASPGNRGLPTFDTPAGRIGLATGYDVLFPETLRVLAGKGADLVCAPTCLNFPNPLGLPPSAIRYTAPMAPETYDPYHYVLWRVRADEHEVYLAVANWNGSANGLRANGGSGIFSPSCTRYPWNEVIAEEEPDADYPVAPTLMLMTIDTREQRTGRRSTATLRYAPGEVAGSLTGELDYDRRETIPGNAVRGKPLLRKRVPYWYLDLIRVSPYALPNLWRY